MMRETNPIMRAAARSALNDAIDSLLASGMPIGDVEAELETALDAAIERGHYGAPLEVEPETSGEIKADDAPIWSEIVGPPVPGGVEAGRLERAQLAVGHWVNENSEDLLGFLSGEIDDTDSGAELAAELRDLLTDWTDAGDAFLAACRADDTPAAAEPPPPAEKMDLGPLISQLAANAFARSQR